MRQPTTAANHRIMLHSGRQLDFSCPETSEFTVADIAHGLAHTCRYAGQCDGFYSVAEHSVLVSHVVPHSKLAALFHDAAEAFMGDMPAPLKLLLPAYKVIETRIEQAIFARLGIEWPVPSEVKHADYSVMAAEQEVLMPAGTNVWLREAGVVAANVEIRRLDPTRAKVLFLQRYAELTSVDHPRQACVVSA
jgi:hypothetical protein